MALAAASGEARALPVDLLTFSADPAANVGISADGLSATLTEHATTSPVSLSNPALALPPDALQLEFSYELTVAAQGEDYFDFYIDDLSAPQFWVGGPAGDVALVFRGTHSVDLAALAGTPVPVIFDFSSGFEDLNLDSELTISGVEIVPIPEPGSLLMIGPGLVILACGRRLRSRRAQVAGGATGRGGDLQ
jgi:hypothetical protein